jgi:hypothetical protein
MILTTLILTNLIWILYSLLEGVREGFYWHYENMSKKECDFNINPVFNIQRTMVIAMMAGVLVHITGWFSLLSILCMILMFSFSTMEFITTLEINYQMLDTKKVGEMNQKHFLVILLFY